MPAQAADAVGDLAETAAKWRQKLRRCDTRQGQQHRQRQICPALEHRNPNPFIAVMINNLRDQLFHGIKRATPSVSSTRVGEHGGLRKGRVDLTAFERELLAFLPRLRRFARALAVDAADADDLCQVALERALKAEAQWQRGTRLDSWMYRIMRNCWIDEVRARKGSSAKDRFRRSSGGG